MYVSYVQQVVDVEEPCDQHSVAAVAAESRVADADDDDDEDEDAVVVSAWWILWCCCEHTPVAESDQSLDRNVCPANETDHYRLSR